MVNRVCAALVAVSSAALAACTHVTIYGDTEIRRDSFLRVSVSPGPNGRLLVSRLTGLGVIPGESGFTLGFLSQTLVIAAHPGRCQVVVLAEHEKQVESLKALLQGTGVSADSLCIASTGGKQ